MSQGGWVRLDRRVLREDMKGDIAMIGTWVYVLTEAAWKTTDTRWEGKKQVLQPGQLVASVPQIAHSTGLTPKQVRRAVRRLCEEHRMVTIQGTRGLLITVCNYSDYNGLVEDEGTNEGVRRARGGHAEGARRAGEGHEVGVQANNEQGRMENAQGIRAGARACAQSTDGRVEAVQAAAPVLTHDQAEDILAIDIEATDNPLPDFALEAANFDSEALYGVWWTWTMKKVPNKQYEPDFGPSSFRGAVEQVVRETGITHEKLREVFEFAANSSFWHRLIYHPRWMLRKKEGMLRIEQIVGQMKTKTQFELEKLAQLTEGNGQQHPNYGHTDENGNWTPF